MIRQNLYKEQDCSSSKNGGNITCASLGNNSDVFIMGEKEQSSHIVSLWKVSKERPILALNHHTSEVSSVRFSQDDMSAQSGSQTGVIFKWDLNHAKPQRSFMGHLREVTTLAVESRFGFLLASSGHDTKIKVWDHRQKECVLTFKKHEASVTALSISVNSKQLVSGDSAGQCKLWDMKMGKTIQEWREGTSVKDIKFSHIQHSLSVASDERVVKTYDFQSGFKLESMSFKDSKPYNKISFLQDGNNMVCVNDMQVRFQDVQPADENESVPFQNPTLDSIETKNQNICDINNQAKNNNFYINYIQKKGSKAFIQNTDLNCVKLNFDDIPENWLDPNKQIQYNQRKTSTNNNDDESSSNVFGDMESQLTDNRDSNSTDVTPNQFDQPTEPLSDTSNKSDRQQDKSFEKLKLYKPYNKNENNDQNDQDNQSNSLSKNRIEKFDIENSDSSNKHQSKQSTNKSPQKDEIEKLNLNLFGKDSPQPNQSFGRPEARPETFGIVQKESSPLYSSDEEIQEEIEDDTKDKTPAKLKVDSISERETEIVDLNVIAKDGSVKLTRDSEKAENNSKKIIGNLKELGLDSDAFNVIRTKHKVAKLAEVNMQSKVDEITNLEDQFKKHTDRREREKSKSREPIRKTEPHPTYVANDEKTGPATKITFIDNKENQKRTNNNLQNDNTQINKDDKNQTLQYSFKNKEEDKKEEDEFQIENIDFNKIIKPEPDSLKEISNYNSHPKPKNDVSEIRKSIDAFRDKMKKNSKSEKEGEVEILFEVNNNLKKEESNNEKDINDSNAKVCQVKKQGKKLVEHQNKHTNSIFNTKTTSSITPSFPSTKSEETNDKTIINREEEDEDDEILAKLNHNQDKLNKNPNNNFIYNQTNQFIPNKKMNSDPSLSHVEGLFSDDSSKENHHNNVNQPSKYELQNANLNIPKPNGNNNAKITSPTRNKSPNQNSKKSPNLSSRNHDSQKSIEKRINERSKDKERLNDLARHIVKPTKIEEGPHIKISPHLDKDISPTEESMIFDKDNPMGIDFNNLEVENFKHADDKILEVYKDINSQRSGFLNYLGSKKQEVGSQQTQQKRCKEPLSDILESKIPEESKIEIAQVMIKSENQYGLKFSHLAGIQRNTIRLFGVKNPALISKVIECLSLLFNKQSKEIIDIVSFKGGGVDLNREEKVENCMAVQRVLNSCRTDLNIEKLMKKKGESRNRLVNLLNTWDTFLINFESKTKMK